jgi:hypothetical protein
MRQKDARKVLKCKRHRRNRRRFADTVGAQLLGDKSTPATGDVSESPTVPHALPRLLQIRDPSNRPTQAHMRVFIRSQIITFFS